MRALVSVAAYSAAIVFIGVPVLVLIVAAIAFVQADVRLIAMVQGYEQNHRSCISDRIEWAAL